MGDEHDRTGSFDPAATQESAAVPAATQERAVDPAEVRESAAEALELAEVYDAIYRDRADAGFWLTVAADARGPLLELGCGTGRVLLPLARAGYEVTGLDLSAGMLERCRARLAEETAEVRERVHLVRADMTSFELGTRFAAITVPFGGFQQLRSVDEQLACLGRCRDHLLPGGRLVLDLQNADPAPPSHAGEEPADGQATVVEVPWTHGRLIRWWVEVVAYDHLQQRCECEVSYEVVDADGAVRRLRERLVVRYVFRFEAEHLLVRAGFRVAALYGDYDGSAFAADSPAMIYVAELLTPLTPP